ncbi:MAG: acetyltransferase [Chitinophagaceae bacterium]|nr:acetyltransferase [Chitinophagaceae bacterium]
MKSKLKKPVAVVGYSGHSYVIIDILLNAGRIVTAYCDSSEKEKNPYHLNYLGTEMAVLDTLRSYDYFIGVGHNGIRRKVQEALISILGQPINAIHPTAVVSASVEMKHGVMISANATLNPLVTLGHGVICNTSCSIDHECSIDDFAHVGPGAVLCGNVKIGAGTFVGANAVVKQGVSIGKNVTIGAGTVVIRDIPDNTIVVGNPQRVLVKPEVQKLAAA